MTGWSDEGWGTKRPTAGGPGVVEYASIAELVAASELGLAPGYYEVLTVPATHPQSPRVLTFWDGAAFEPQISTGWEARPTLVNQKWAWDAKEQIFREKLQTGSQVISHLRDLVGNTSVMSRLFTGADIGGTMNVEADLFEHRVASTSGSLLYGQFPGTLWSGATTFVFAGKFLQKTTGGTAVSAMYLGAGSPNRGLGLFADLGGSLAWGASSLAVNYDTGVLCRTTLGDVVLLSYDAGNVTLWINGVKYGPSSIGAVTFQATDFMGFGNESFATNWFGNFDFQLMEIANTTLSDADAADWTSYLQDRYSIPPL